MCLKDHRAVRSLLRHGGSRPAPGGGETGAFMFIPGPTEKAVRPKALTRNAQGGHRVGDSEGRPIRKRWSWSISIPREWTPDEFKAQVDSEVCGIKLRATVESSRLPPAGRGPSIGLRARIQQFVAGQKDWLPRGLRRSRTVVAVRRRVVFGYVPANNVVDPTEGYGTEYGKWSVEGWTLQRNGPGRELSIATFFFA